MNEFQTQYERLATLDHDKMVRLMKQYTQSVESRPFIRALSSNPTRSIFELEIENFFTVVRMDEHWKYLPEILMLRHDCNGDGRYKRAGTRTKPPYRCEVCEVELPEHLQIVVRVWAASD